MPANLSRPRYRSDPGGGSPDRRGPIGADCTSQSAAMKVAIMQPYFFPYIGYFQLIGSVDLFVIYDNIKSTNHFTNLQNVTFEDGEGDKRGLSKEDALKNTKSKKTQNAGTTGNLSNFFKEDLFAIIDFLQERSVHEFR